jgi:micrococcal nuclease
MKMHSIVLLAILGIFLLFPMQSFGASSEPIPQWIKNNAWWWANSQISDKDFAKGIEYLIQKGIVKIPQTSVSSDSSEEIPSWLRNNAGWWAQGLLSDDEFVQGIQYLVSKGMIRISQVENNCLGNAQCFSGTVTQIIDGDTIKVDGKSIRFALASAPELDEIGGIESKQFVEILCPVGSIATVDEDDRQTQGSYGRILGVVYCNGVNLNEMIIKTGYGYVTSNFCNTSEFATQSWAEDECSKNSVSEFLDNGCRRTHPYLWSDGLCYNLPEDTYKKSQVPSCDPSYPDVCIAPYPPDLDCDEIPYKNFRVVGSDPHGFDRDKDGIGCESGSSSSQSSSSQSSSSQSSSSQSSSSSSSSSKPDCDPSYPDVCIPPYPPDLNCGDIPYKNFRVVGSDPHRFDGDKDGIGCES